MNNSINQFEVRKHLQEAFANGSYLITVTVLDKEKQKLVHYYAWDNFPLDDVIPSLGHIAGQIETNETKAA